MDTIIHFLTTPNETLCKLLTTPLILVDVIVNMLLYLTILNINPSVKQKKIYIFITFIIILSIKIMLPNSLALICLLVIGINCYMIFEHSVLKSIIAMGIMAISNGIAEIIAITILRNFINIDFETNVITPLYKIIVLTIIYTIVYSFYKVIKFFKININILDTMPLKAKKLLILNSISGILLLTPYIFFISYYRNTIPVIFSCYILLSTILIFVINFRTIIRTNELATTKAKLQNAELYNKTLNTLYDNIRTFKHDFNNIVQVIGGFIMVKDLEGLRKYHSSLVADCQTSNNLSALNPESINNPAIFGLLASKYLFADDNGIKMNFEIFMDLSNLNVDIYKLSKILGILIDNALEASLESNEKTVNILMRQDVNTKVQIIKIENTFNDESKIDVEKIYEKDFSTKNRNSGLGLWEVNKIVKKTSNLKLNTFINDDYFAQELLILPN